MIKEQPKYGPDSGDYYPLLMGREFLLGRFVLLLEFDNKDDGAVDGMQLIEKLNIDQYEPPLSENPFGRQALLVLRRRSTAMAHYIEHDNYARRC